MGRSGPRRCGKPWRPPSYTPPRTDGNVNGLQCGEPKPVQLTTSQLLVLAKQSMQPTQTSTSIRGSKYGKKARAKFPWKSSPGTRGGDWKGPPRHFGPQPMNQQKASRALPGESRGEYRQRGLRGRNRGVGRLTDHLATIGIYRAVNDAVANQPGTKGTVYLGIVAGTAADPLSLSADTAEYRYVLSCVPVHADTG